MRHDPIAASWQRRAYLALFEFNPLYLLSAALVLVGVQLASEALVRRGSAGQLGVAAIADLYAWALIGSAALLVRTGSRRPAVMLAVLALLFMLDPVAHTEMCARLGAVGTAAALAWLISFVAKLRALAWALQLAPSISARAVLWMGATGLAAIPQLLPHLDRRPASIIVAVWLFGVAATAAWSRRRIASIAALDAWGHSVLDRASRGVWLGVFAALIVHVVFWLERHRAGLDPFVLYLVGGALATRWLTRERSIWLAVAGLVLGTCIVTPQWGSLAAALSALALLLRAHRRPSATLAPQPPMAGDPYRREPMAPPPAGERRFVASDPAARLRLHTGAAACAYLLVWLHDFHGGSAPPHLLGLDAVLAILTVLWAWRGRVRLPLSLPIASAIDLAMRSGVIPTPQSDLAIGLACVTAGFASLAAALAGSLWWRRIRERASARGSAGVGEAFAPPT